SEFIPSTAWEFMPVGGKRIPLKELTPCWPLGTPYSIHDDPPLIGLQGNQPVIVEPNGQAKLRNHSAENAPSSASQQE
ncbi:hypothetical protein PFISCL1PPCAC_28502, partial [Pristionchus fissidentatus]